MPQPRPHTPPARTEQRDNGKPLNTARQIGDLLGLSARTVMDKWRAGDIPGHQLPGSSQVRFDEDEVLAVVKSTRKPKGGD